MSKLPDSKQVADEEGVSSPEQETHRKDTAFAMHLLNDGLLEPFNGYTFAIYREQVVDKGKDYKRLLNRVTRKFGIRPLQVVLIDPESGIM